MSALSPDWDAWWDEARSSLYFPDRLCTRGHRSPRYTSNFGCTACIREDSSTQDPERVRARAFKERSRSNGICSVFGEAALTGYPDDPKFAAWIERARDVSLLEAAMMCGARMKKSGAEYISACPSCGGEDRLSVNMAKGVWNCRGAEGGQSVVDFVMHIGEASFLEAVETLTGEPPPGGKRQETAEERIAREARIAKRRHDSEMKKARDEKAEAAKRRRDEEACEALLARAVRIEGTHAEAYLRARGLTPARRLLGDIRFVPDVPYWGYASATSSDLEHIATLPAMVCVPRDVNGQPVGVHQTFLDPVEPRKWVASWEAHLPKRERRNKDKKFRTSAETLTGGMIRLGIIGERLAIGEGVETCLSWHAMGYGPEDVSLAAAMSLDNLTGGCTGGVPHPTKRKPDGSPYRIGNGIPDPEKPGVILPDWVREVIILGDGDSDPYATRALIMAQVRRWRAEGRIVSTHCAPPGADWNDVCMEQLKAERSASAEECMA